MNYNNIIKQFIEIIDIKIKNIIDNKINDRIKLINGMKII